MKPFLGVQAVKDLLVTEQATAFALQHMGECQIRSTHYQSEHMYAYAI